jgi:cysteinyl-tRNA synthetase
MIQIYDTLQRKTVPLQPREEGRVTMYACGPTVYNYVHIGNARTQLWFDFIRRYLRYRGFDVTYVSNYTDVDDRIIERANIEGIPADGIAKKYAAAFEANMAALGVENPDILVRATEHIEDMVKAVEGLIEKGAAYEVGGDVFFSVENFDGYGKLSRRTLEDMRARERIEPHPGKRHPLDFALWKAAKEGEPSWPSPWGPGRPGWHIECSVMSRKYLGMGFDLHGGATDLIFPHHENEIAQAEALEEGEFVRHWLHSGLVQMESEKMSKSLGNVVLVNEVLEIYSGEVIRYWALAGSYRTQAVFADETLQDAAGSYERWQTFNESARHLLGADFPPGPESPRRPIGKPIDDAYIERFVTEMDDDFNSAGAVAVVHELVRDGNKLLHAAEHRDENAREQLVGVVRSFLELAFVLGFDFVAEGYATELTGNLIEYLLELREQAREEKAFERSDAIRARLSDLGVVVEDTPAGSRWRIQVGGAR